MARLNIPPTKSNLLLLRRQLAFATEGYELLEQKRQILIFELMSRRDRAHAVEMKLRAALVRAHLALREATLDVGSLALDQLAVTTPAGLQVMLAEQHLMGLKLSRVSAQPESAGTAFGVGGTTDSADQAFQRFRELVPVLVEFAELQDAVRRLARELRKTQRRCNALSKILIPNYRETISYLAAALEEREREAFVISRLLRDQLAAARGQNPAGS